MIQRTDRSIEMLRRCPVAAAIAECRYSIAALESVGSRNLRLHLLKWQIMLIVRMRHDRCAISLFLINPPVVPFPSYALHTAQINGQISSSDRAKPVLGNLLSFAFLRVLAAWPLKSRSSQVQ